MATPTPLLLQAVSAALREMEEGYRERCNYCGGDRAICDRLTAPSGCRAQNARAIAEAVEREQANAGEQAGRAVEPNERATASQDSVPDTELVSPAPSAPGEGEPAGGETPITKAATFEILSSLQSGTDKVVQAHVAEDLERALNRERARVGEAERNYQFMVDRAANEKLDGYRELGQRAADAESRADSLAAELEATREYAARYRWLRKGLGILDAAREKRLANMPFAIMPTPDASYPLHGDELDAAIDQARETGKC